MGRILGGPLNGLGILVLCGCHSGVKRGVPELKHGNRRNGAATKQIVCAPSPNQKALRVKRSVP